jgi:hypothetical protein
MLRCDNTVQCVTLIPNAGLQHLKAWHHASPDFAVDTRTLDDDDDKNPCLTECLQLLHLPDC